jgi:hypothetical protein
MSPEGIHCPVRLIFYLAGILLTGPESFFRLKFQEMKGKALIFILVILLSAGCAEVLNVLQSSGSGPLSEDEVIRGLREALITGSKNSSSLLGATDGYFGDAAVKILLPDEAKVIVDNLSRLPGGEKLVQDVVLRINRAAEDAAREAAPVFSNSIRQMSIRDAFNILNGSDDAATSYLRQTTFNELYSLYKPKITASTEKDIVGSISTKESWETLTGKWNQLAGSAPGKIAGLKSVNTDLDDYLTKKALDGMFIKLALEEQKIRKDISARVSPLLQRVFGSLDNKTK